MNTRAAIFAVHRHRETLTVLINLKGRVMVNTWKDISTGFCVHPRVCISPWDINPLLCTLFIVPFDGDTVSGIFRTNPPRQRDKTRTHTKQSDQTNTSDSISIDEFWSKGCREVLRHDIRVNPIVGENTTINNTLHHRNSHRKYLLVGRLEAKSVHKTAYHEETSCEGTLQQRNPKQRMQYKNHPK